MTQATFHPLAWMLAGGALVAIGFVLGASTTQPIAMAQQGRPLVNAPNRPNAAPAPAQQAEATPGVPGVYGIPIPSRGGALVKGKDGKAYVVEPSGLVIQARGNGRSLELP